MLRSHTSSVGDRCLAPYSLLHHSRESFALTADYSPTRITVTVVDGAVTAVVVG